MLICSVGGSRYGVLVRVRLDANETPLVDVCIAYFFREGHRLADSLAGAAPC